jgi:general secretion pathway protein G
MKWLYRHLHKKEKGFTLVELMVVIIILAVLTGIAIPSYLSLRNRARIQATRAEMQNIGTAIAIYEADMGAYPATTVAALITALESDDSSGTGAYMANVPTEDAWAAAYTYVLASGSYTLTSTGATPDIVMVDGVFSDE